MLKLNKPIVFFDLETTGVDPNDSRIVEFAAVRMEVDGSRKEVRHLLNPGVEIPAEATEVHGYADSDVWDSPSFSDVALEVRQLFDGADIGGFNVLRYDIPLLNSELERCQKAALDLSDVAVVDAYQIFCHREPRDLSTAVKMFCGRDHEGAHGALADTLATIDVLEGQMTAYDDLPQTPEDIFNQVRDPDAVDLAGKLKRKNGEIVLTFGKHKGLPLYGVPQGYLKWALNNGVFGSEVRDLVMEAAGM